MNQKVVNLMNKKEDMILTNNKDGMDIYIDDMRKVIFISVNKKLDKVKLRNDLQYIEEYSIMVVDSIRSINYIGGELNG